MQVRQNCRATLVIPPRTSIATIVTICCNHGDREYFQYRITRKLGSTATSTVITRLLPLTNYISGTENETQRALLGHTNGNIEMRSPSAAAMLTVVAAATIVRFPPVGRCGCNFKITIFKPIPLTDILCTACKIVVRWIPQNSTDDKSTLVQVMAWCRQATSHYLSQCWPRSVSPYGVTRPQWVITLLKYISA